MTAATLPFPASSPKSRPWSPTARERMIFQWVKFEGKTQGWVAQQLEMNQSTVSRIIERYERWIARGGPSQEGALSHDERVRAAWWLTYERNEWIITSAMRLAGEMEHGSDATRSNVTHHASQPSKELLVRTEHFVLDRSAVANRYLRLAYRVGMDQLKLLEKEPLPALEPLTMEDSDCEQLHVTEGGDISHAEARRARSEPKPENELLRGSAAPRETSTVADPPILPSMHDEATTETHSSPIADEVSVEMVSAKKLFRHAYAVADNPPETAEGSRYFVELTLPASDERDRFAAFDPRLCCVQTTDP